MSQLKGAPGVAKVFLEDAAQEIGMDIVRSPVARGFLSKMGERGRKLLRYMIQTASGYFDVPGKGPAIALVNEGLDALISGGAKALSEYEHLTDDQLRGKAMEVISEAMVSLADTPGRLFGGHWHPNDCPTVLNVGRGNRNRGQTGDMTFGRAIEFGVPVGKCCHSVMEGEYRLSLEREEVYQPSIFELCEKVEVGSDKTLATKAKKFRKHWADLNDRTKKQFVLLADQEGALEKLRIVLATPWTGGQIPDGEYRQLLETMVKLPPIPVASGMDKVGNALGKLGDRFADWLEKEDGEEQGFFDTADELTERGKEWLGRKDAELNEKRAAFAEKKNEKRKMSNALKFAIALMVAMLIGNVVLIASKL